ncbi:MAG: hypothetical protein CXR31_00330 [Geobacter sp.]|nr:MAG: hypothetical protein CXR31_00330 [Geobacter sp.]
MTWSVPTAKHDALRARYHTCTCPSGAEITYNWRDMNVVDADFEQAAVSSSDRYIWYTIRCFDCGNYVLDNMPFGIQETGYALFCEAKALATEYAIDVNGAHLDPDYELAIRVVIAEAVRDIWHRYCQGNETSTCSHLLMHHGEYKLLYDCIRCVLTDFAQLKPVSVSPGSDLSRAIDCMGIACLEKLAEEMIFRFRTATPRILYGKNYHYLHLPLHMAQPATHCITYAAGNADKMAHYMFATYGKTVARGLSEADYIRSFESSRESIAPYYRLLLANLTHFHWLA